MPLSSIEIQRTVEGRRGVPPFRVWSAAFIDVIAGIPVEDSGMPAHRGSPMILEDAIRQYVEFAGVQHGETVIITVDPRIEDANGVKVYP